MQGSLHILDPKDFQPEEEGLGVALEITSENLTKGLYEQRMAKAGSSGRAVYDRIKLAAPHGVCPLCGVRQVATLDHHLPRAKFAALSVVPLNLIPACYDCNRFKLDGRPSSESDQTLNPYFEDVSVSRWLRCQVIEGAPAVVRFFVEAPSDWSATLEERVRHHFATFRLGELYSYHAITELSSVRSLLRQILDAVGESTVRTYLAAQSWSAQADTLNSWKGAMYEALAANDWYCAGGFDRLAGGGSALL
ncbi:HNH endonuclease signature motif containing protein [Nonomuraea sp. NPDC048916]|uniref:HNH endonuclease n=1 Tax=Nonomuraea sp. NPDC048916 TaxID=3154232 RepID=UPI0033CDEAEA